MIGSMGVAPETARVARAMFKPEQVPDALEVLGWYDDVQADEVHRAVLALSKGGARSFQQLSPPAWQSREPVLRHGMVRHRG
jgi:hypothetical protein